MILAAYEEWGTECVRRLAGMFAFAIWDQMRERLWLVRDRLGKKPVYYSYRDGKLTFASELKGLLADRAFPRDLDRQAIGLYLRYGYVPAPLSVYTAARKLPPGHEAIFEHGQLNVKRYWDPLAYAGRRNSISESEAARRAGTASYHSGSPADDRGRPARCVPLGGIDSSLVVALMQEQRTTPVRTFTIRLRTRNATKPITRRR